MNDNLKNTCIYTKSLEETKKIIDFYAKNGFDSNGILGSSCDCYYGVNFSVICASTSLKNFGFQIREIELPKKDDFVLPENWCVRITLENREVLEEYRKTMPFYDKNSTCTCLISNALGTILIPDNRFNNHMCWADYNPTIAGYIEITFEQFKKYILKENKTM